MVFFGFFGVFFGFGCFFWFFLVFSFHLCSGDSAETPAEPTRGETFESSRIPRVVETHDCGCVNGPDDQSVRVGEWSRRPEVCVCERTPDVQACHFDILKHVAAARPEISLNKVSAAMARRVLLVHSAFVHLFNISRLE